MIANVERHIRWFWGLVMCPLMFGLVGAYIDFASIPHDTISRACAIVCAGAALFLSRA